MALAMYGIFSILFLAVIFVKLNDRNGAKSKKLPKEGVISIFWSSSSRSSHNKQSQQASFFSGRQVVAATWYPPLSVKLAEIFDFSTSSPLQANHFEKPALLKLAQIAWKILFTLFCLERFRGIVLHYSGRCIAFLKAKRREKDLARDVSSKVTTICSNFIYIF